MQSSGCAGRTMREEPNSLLLCAIVVPSQRETLILDGTTITRGHLEVTSYDGLTQSGTGPIGFKSRRPDQPSILCSNSLQARIALSANICKRPVAEPPHLLFSSASRQLRRQRSLAIMISDEAEIGHVFMLVTNETDQTLSTPSEKARTDGVCNQIANSPTDRDEQRKCGCTFRLPYSDGTRTRDVQLGKMSFD
jgi:hypothetical protein